MIRSRPTTDEALTLAALLLKVTKELADVVHIGPLRAAASLALLLIDTAQVMECQSYFPEEQSHCWTRI